MILMHIICKQKEQAEEISDYLMDEKLIISSTIYPEVLKKQLVNGEKKTSKHTIIHCRTKALLFNEIEERIKGKYPGNIPIMYSVPIVNMNWEQAKQLIGNTYKV